MIEKKRETKDITGEFLSLDGERFYAIRNFDRMPAFFVSLVSDSDHWLFISSSGGLTAGRVSPETALFPYITVDKIHESSAHTGSKTLIRTTSGGQDRFWEPFNREHDDRYRISRNLYKNSLGNKILFEEINHDLQLAFRYAWKSSDEFGFIRQCELQNLGEKACEAELLDGIQNILPAGTPRATQGNASYLVDAYKYSELDAATGLACYTLFSAITDRAEPCESLRATTVFCLGLEDYRILLSAQQLGDFHNKEPLVTETGIRGTRGAYFVSARLSLPPGDSRKWQQVANVEQSQRRVVSLKHRLADLSALAKEIEASIDAGSDGLARIMAAADGLQMGADESTLVHHYANTLFNVLRGGIFDNGYLIDAHDFRRTVKHFNRKVYARRREFLQTLPPQIDRSELLAAVLQQNDAQLARLTYEYLPITFGRRHGDPSRPWNQFSIRLKDEHGNHILSYEGNWRDIFQNWEALLLSYPEFTENVIAKFVNASTIDGYNPYRITNEGIDWEVEEPDDPWSYIGYWGDHQIIYLQKLLELSLNFHPERLGKLLHEQIFSYANVPYRIRPFEALLENAKSTVDYDQALAEIIEQRVAELGADAKLLLNTDGEVYQVNLLEKLLVPLLSKLGNLVVDGGIWLNTQRPEWNDANNALVGQGLSMVTLYYMRRYVVFLQQLLAGQSGTFSLTREVSVWLNETATALQDLQATLGNGAVDDKQRFALLAAVGQAASRYRQRVYAQAEFSATVDQDLEPIRSLCKDALLAIDHSIRNNLREDGLYHAYNLLELGPESASVDRLYPMLEGQVAVLSSGAIEPGEVARVVESLFESDMYRPDQDSFLLYPDRDIPGFLEKNILPAEKVEAIGLLVKMLEAGDRRIVEQDDDGHYRFNSAMSNADALNERLDALAADYGELTAATRNSLQDLYEQVFKHKAFTGRSGGMFAFEGLGSIYWHMVAKLLLAVQENYFAARDQNAGDAVCQQLARLYYRVRKGIGFNKGSAEYGAFPTDPYSHTPQHMGAQQPGMTGQVKEEILTRFGELGVRIDNGAVRFQPGLLRAREFLNEPLSFSYVDVDDQWQSLAVPEQALAFTWCQVPCVYRLDAAASPSVTVIWHNDERLTLPGLDLPVEIASEIFRRSGKVRQITLELQKALLHPA